MRNFIKKEIEKAVKKLFKKKRAFEVTSDTKFGDYSSNVAMVTGGNLRMNAERIKTELAASKNIPQIFSKTEITGPGFLNFYLSEKGLIEGLKCISDCPKQGLGQKVQVEFISANPTGELHIGHGRSAFYGDALANILEAAGYEVEREYLINDSKESTQIKELGKTVLGKGEFYLTDYLKRKIKDLRFKIQDDGEVGYAIAREIQKDNEKFIKRIGIKIDKWFSEEKELRQKTEFKKALELLKNKKLIYEKDGAIWLKTSKYGDEEDRVIVRSTGEITYFLSDIAYHINKNKGGYKKIIDIWGADHQGHVKRMMAVKKMLGWKFDLDILISQLVTLKEGEKRKKLSKRRGDIILLKDLIKEVGLDVCRWFYLEKSLSTHMEFDMDLAKERSQKNPVYYVQYAGARMASILAKSQISNLKSQKLERRKFDFAQVGLAMGSLTKKNNVESAEAKSKLSPIRNLIKKLIQFPEVVEDIAKDYQVQRLTKYAYELASEFSQFYRDVRVIGSKNEKELLALVALTRKVLEDSLKLLGIKYLDKM
ncbi:MAG: arginine--tRNA ligase [Patescibacteria group bacterium]